MRKTTLTAAARSTSIFRSLAAICVAGIAFCAVPAAAELKDYGNRLEGILGRKYSSGTLSLVSFACVFQPFEYSQKVELRVSFYKPKGTNPKIVARNRHEIVLYHMELKPSGWVDDQWNDFGPWPSSDVLFEQKMGSADIGVVTYLDTPDKAVITPALVYFSPDKPKSNPSCTAIFLVNGELLEYGAWVNSEGSSAPSGRASGKGDWKQNSNVEISFDSRNWSDGWKTLKISSEFRDYPVGAPQLYKFYYKK